METKYVFIDIDGTLLSHEIGIPKSAMEALEKAKKNGHKLFINTGRVQSAVDDHLLAMDFDGFIFAAGGHIVVGEETLAEIVLTSQQLNHLFDVLNLQDVGIVWEGPEKSFYNWLALRYFRDRLDRKSDLPPQVQRHLVQENMVSPLSELDLETDKINKVSVFFQTLEQLHNLQAALPEEYFLIAYENNLSGEIIQRDIHKFSAVEKVLNYFEADVSQAMALGDSMNDYEMVKYSGIGIAMGNGDERLKAVADYTTFSVNDKGFYHAFKRYELI